MTVNITTCILIIFRTKPDVKQNVEESTVKNMKFVEITNQKENNYEIYNKIFNMAYDIKPINEFYFSRTS